MDLLLYTINITPLQLLSSCLIVPSVSTTSDYFIHHCLTIHHILQRQQAARKFMQNKYEYSSSSSATYVWRSRMTSAGAATLPLPLYRVQEDARPKTENKRIGSFILVAHGESDPSLDKKKERKIEFASREDKRGTEERKSQDRKKCSRIFENIPIIFHRMTRISAILDCRFPIVDFWASKLFELVDLSSKDSGELGSFAEEIFILRLENLDSFFDQLSFKASLGPSTSRHKDIFVPTCTGVSLE